MKPSIPCIPECKIKIGGVDNPQELTTLNCELPKPSREQEMSEAFVLSGHGPWMSWKVGGHQRNCQVHSGTGVPCCKESGSGGHSPAP